MNTLLDPNFLLFRNAKVNIITNLAEFSFPTEGEVRNVSSWREISNTQELLVTGDGVPEATIQRIKEQGLIARFILVPAAVDKVGVYLQLLPDTLEGLKEKLVDDAGQQIVEMEDPDIPGISFRGHEAGVQGGLAELVPLCSNLAPESGFGVMPVLLSTGGKECQPPPSSTLKFEMFQFLRRAVMPEPLCTYRDWETAFKQAEFESSLQPPLLWPEPEAIRHQIETGK